MVNIFKGMKPQTEVNLLKAVQTAGRILVKAIQQSPQRLQFFREVGRFMVLVDQTDNAGANRAAIRDAFQHHNISLGSDLIVAPQVVIATVSKGAKETSGAWPRAFRI